jgi:hypothetical protein
MKFCMNIDYKYSYKSHMKFHKTTVANMAVMHNFEVMSDKESVLQ